MRSICTSLTLLFVVALSKRRTKCRNNLELDIPAPDAVTSDGIVTKVRKGRMIRDVEVTVDLDHSYVGDLLILLVHLESSEFVTLFNRSCGSDNDMKVTFSDAGDEWLACQNLDQSCKFQPLDSLDVYDGLSLEEHTWGLAVVDDVPGDAGILHSWCISFDDSVARYVALDERVSSMGEAREKCEEMLGSDLAVIRNDDANLQAINVCAQKCEESAVCDGCWIGLSDLKSEGTFSWVDGAAVGFSDWKGSNPNNRDNSDCALLKKGVDYRWDDCHCDVQNIIPLCRNPDFYESEESLLSTLQNVLSAVVQQWLS